jgi:hypothetical protein
VGAPKYQVEESTNMHSLEPYLNQGMTDFESDFHSKVETSIHDNDLILTPIIAPQSG